MKTKNLLSEELLSKIFDKVSSVEIAEIYCKKNKNRSFEVKNGKIETIKASEEMGLSLRVEKKGQIGFAYSSDLSESTLDTLAKSAILSMEESESIEGAEINRNIQQITETDLQINDTSAEHIPDDELIASACSMESAALGVDTRIKRVRNAITALSSSNVYIVNSLGNSASFSSTSSYGYLTTVAESGGDAQVGSEYDARRFYGDIDFTSLGVQAANNAIELLGAKTVSSALIPVVLSPLVASELLEILVNSLKGENIIKQKSMFADMTGRQIASSVVSVTDNGLAPKGLGTVPFDDEGMPTAKTVLVNNGTLEEFIHTMRSAKKMGEKPTGNGFRGDFKSLPATSISNLSFAPGNKLPEDILKEVSSGFYVKEVMGLHTANPVSGDFSVGATGQWIENGISSFPVREAVLAGNIKDLLMDIISVGNDTRFFGRVGSPTILVEKMSLSGN